LIVEESPGRWVDADTGKPLDFKPDKPPEEVRVLGIRDPVTGEEKIITADYDMLNFGKRGKHQQPGFNSDTGFITKQQQEAVADLNAAVQNKLDDFDITKHGGKPYEGGNVVHHGGEENFFKSPGIEGEPVTVFEPNGNIITIPSCDIECMKEWCRAPGPGGKRRCDPTRICPQGQVTGCIPVDADRLFKDYFHLKRLEGWNLDPNPRWDWGSYNGLGGWIQDLHCKGCDDILWAKP